MSLLSPHSGERSALAARREHGLDAAGPLDILQIAEEQFDVPVLVDRFDDDKIAGVLLRRPGGDRFVGVNADHHTVRQRFTLAHELGHLHMGHQARVDLASDVFGAGSSLEEVEANYFAAEFLAPRATVRAWLERRDLGDRASEPSTVAQLALAFGVSLPTACFRLERAGLIRSSEKRRLLAEVSANPQLLIKQHAPHRLVDGLHAIWLRRGYPRIPRQTAVYAAQALGGGLLDDDEYAAIVPNALEIDFHDWIS